MFGLSPTNSGFATLPLMAGLLIASIGSGQIISRTGRYGIFPSSATLVMASGFVVLTFITYDKPIWFIFIAMFLIGLGLGQLMQTLTMASQNAVEPHQMGVATGARRSSARSVERWCRRAALGAVRDAAGQCPHRKRGQGDDHRGTQRGSRPEHRWRGEERWRHEAVVGQAGGPAQAGIQKKLTARTAPITSLPDGDQKDTLLASAAQKAHASVIDGHRSGRLGQREPA
ncbi:MAG: hypothetical protein WDM88_10280 [Galbitalea sp.]